MKFAASTPAFDRALSVEIAASEQIRMRVLAGPLRARPMRPGDPFGDHGQRAVMLALIFEPVLANEDGVGVPAPLAHQCRAGLWGDTGIEGPAFLLESSSQGLQAAPQ